ncbi:hypothetical protein EB061_12255, partial [bacterium]|nr:hypothetical protein [bacterium]
ADVADFSRRLFGLDADRAGKVVERALRERSLREVEGLNVDVAAHWGTSPEVSREILRNWYRGLL